MNSHLRAAGGAKKSCDDYSSDELNDIVKHLFKSLSSEFQDIYNSNDDRRSMRFASLDEYEASWLSEEDDETTRHAKCFEIGEMWSHHLSEAAKPEHVGLVPAIPVFDQNKSTSELYTKSASCVTGHAMVKGDAGSSSHQWPDWPEELHYKAKGHGAYPFWWGGGSDSGDADLEVWWSEKQGYESFYHSTCTGQSSWLQGTACWHLMFAPETAGGEPVSYLFNDAAKKGASGGQCCLSNPTSGGGGSFGPSEQLAPSQGNFWNTFTDMGEVDFNGVYYQGKAHYYVLRNVPGAIADFWYFTDLNGKPVQQGEAGTGPTDQGYPTSRGHTIWHDYDPSSFDTSAQSASISEIPAVCKTTSLTCAFP